MNNHVANNGFMIRQTADVFRKELKQILIRCGGSVFEKLGISPIFNISGLRDSAFQMFGEEIQGGRFISGGMSNRHHFSFERVDRLLKLRDLNTESEHTVHDIISFPYDGSVGNVFDPEELINVFDPTSCISESNIYILSQWVEGEEMERVVYKTLSFSFNGYLIANPNYSELANGNSRARITGPKKHKNVYRLSTLVKAENQLAFEQNIQQNIMNDNWLSTFIENHNDLFFN